LFAADLAFLQDFYGVINFGNQEEYEALLAAQQQTPPPTTPLSPGVAPETSTAAPAVVDVPAAAEMSERRSRRSAIEEIPAAGR
jgi:hypothetical protein